jgi:hypothetical protein
MNTLFYTFSTIAQTLATAIALLAAFLLYRLQVLGSQIEDNISRIAIPLGMIFQDKEPNRVEDLQRSGQHEKILQLANSTPFPSNYYQATIERALLPILFSNRKSVLRQFWIAVYLTAGLVAFSVLILVVTPLIAESSCWTWLSLSLGFIWFVACLVSYVLFLRKAFQTPTT